ncbi:MAG TPA: hypothetical protein VEI97_18165 [bacterium]|nr:hypothetical protein [bacterium]
MDKRLTRRNFVAAWLGLFPGLGLLTYLIPVWWRYLFPTMEPYGFFSEQVLGSEKPQFVENTSKMAKAWDMREFEFVRQSRLFTSQGEFNTRVPGFLVAIPKDPETPPGTEMDPSELSYKAWSRICVHLGCVFTYQTTKEAVRTGFNYAQPVNNVHFACPCHLSVYDLAQLVPVPDAKEEWQVGPKVVSGPAPRPARVFKTEVRDNGDIFIIQLEGGGLS